MRILFIPMDSHGHVNACIGLATALKGYGHDCVFLVSRNWTSILHGRDFRVEIIQDSESKENKDPQENWAKFAKKACPSYQKSPLDQISDLLEPSYCLIVNFVRSRDDHLHCALKKIKPDAIILNFYVTVPSIVRSGIPWIPLTSWNPLHIYDGLKKRGVPPARCGLALGDDPKLFERARTLIQRALRDIKREFDEYLLSKRILPDSKRMFSPSPYLNIYSYPEELDYKELGQIPENWFRLDHLVRPADNITPLGVDESFFMGQDKIIYFTLGSMGSCDINLMKKFIIIMAKSRHKFIVSMGPCHQQIQLPSSNMTGGKFLNQVKILPRVDLAIHHGGNNTFIETLYFGKPSIVMPLYGDQHDNGRRTVDRGIGKCLNPHSVTERKFLTSIDEILENRNLIDKVSKIGERIRNSRSHAWLNQKLESMVKNIPMSKF